MYNIKVCCHLKAKSYLKENLGNLLFYLYQYTYYINYTSVSFADVPKSRLYEVY